MATAEQYAELCDVVERAWQHWPVEPDKSRHTSDYARQGAKRILEVLDLEVNRPDEESSLRSEDEIRTAEHEHFERLWHYRTVSVKRSAEELAAVADQLREIEASYDDLEIKSDFDLGQLHGRLEALTWVLGGGWHADT